CAPRGQRRSEVHGCGRLSDSTLLVGQRDDPRLFVRCHQCPAFDGLVTNDDSSIPTAGRTVLSFHGARTNDRPSRTRICLPARSSPHCRERTHASTCSRVGIAVMPKPSIEKEATILAKAAASKGSLVSARRIKKAAAKTSPAPVGSTTFAGRAGRGRGP